MVDTTVSDGFQLYSILAVIFYYCLKLMLFKIDDNINRKTC